MKRRGCNFRSGVTDIGRKFLWTALIMTISAISLSADAPPFKIYHLTVQEGLIQNAVISLKEDNRGFLWVGSEFGLGCYDGHEFHRYTRVAGKAGALFHPIVFCIDEDHRGNMWFGTERGLDRLDYRTQRFTHYFIDPEYPDQADRNWVFEILADEGNLFWLGTQGNGLILFDTDTGKIVRHFRHRPEQPRSISDNLINHIFKDSRGNIWVATWNGVNRYDRQTGDFTRFTRSGSQHQRCFTSIQEDGSGRLWTGSLEGLLVLDPATGEFRFPFEGRPTGGGLKSSPVTCMVVDPFGFLWAGTRTGLNRIDTRGLEVNRYVHEADDPRGISNNWIWDMTLDANGVLWLGTYGGGLDKIVFQTKPFKNYYEIPGVSSGERFEYLLGGVEDDAGIVWMGTRGNGLIRWDRAGNHRRWIRTDPSNPASIIGNDIPIIIQSSRDPDILWLGIRGGVDRFNKKTEVSTHFRHDRTRQDSLLSNLVYALLEDRSGVLWVGTWGGGLNRLAPGGNRFDHYPSDPENPYSISSNVVWDIHEDRKGRLWIGTGGGGLNRLDRDTMRFHTYRNDPDNLQSLSNDYIFCLHEDLRGTIWLGTLGGLNLFDPETGKFERYTILDGLADDVVYGILEDEHRDLWCSTNKGLSRFNPRLKTFRNYSPHDGLASYEFNMHSYWKNRKGEFYFGGISGLNVFKPLEIRDNPRIPPVFITGLKIFNRPVPVDPDGSSPLRESIMTTRRLRLSYRQHSVTFEFAALDFTFPERNQYAYKLEGVDHQWIPLGNKREITFAHLAPGRYTLRVKGSNSDGVWNQEGRSLELVIIPPFWQTWWFRALMLLVLIAAALGLHRVRLKRVTRRLLSEAARERFFNQKGISAREREIILLVLQGKSNKQIEDELFISMGTVKNHVYNIFKKLDINSRVQLINLFTDITIE